MIRTESNAKNGEFRQDEILREYASITESLVADLESCKAEQTRCRAELEALSRETKHAAKVARESMSRADAESSSALIENRRESLENLRKRISVLELEKETVLRMWQASSRAVEALESEVRRVDSEGRATGRHEERIKGTEEHYSEVIKALESKLLKAKENLAKSQALWETDRERAENLTKERNDLEGKLSASQRTIAASNRDLESCRNELEKAREEKLVLHEKVREARNFASAALAKGEESKRKVAEALEIAETAIAEKEAAVIRESRASEERKVLEARLNSLVEEYATRFDRELAAARESFERAGKKTALETKELKLELREKVTLLDRLEREKRLLEEELERAGSEMVVHKSRILELEKKLKDGPIEALENCRKTYEEKIRHGEERAAELEARLTAASDRLRRTHLYGNKELEDRLREADDRAREILERYSSLERRLTRTLDEKENLSCELRTLRTDYDREINKRDLEKRSLEAQIREIRDESRLANQDLEKSNGRCASLIKRVESLQRDLEERHAVTHGTEELSLRLKTLQDKFERRTNELTEHVETHRKLCTRWKDEAKSIATKFHLRTKEFREKVGVLRRENDRLNKELLVCRQRLVDSGSPLLDRYDQDGTR